MKTYRVVWEIDIDAENPKEAAQNALSVMREPDSTAVFFSVTDKEGQESLVDLIENNS